MNVESGRRGMKPKTNPKIVKPRRAKEKDDYDWRADTSKTPQAPSIMKGYKSAKHMWACKFALEKEREKQTSTAQDPTPAAGSPSIEQQQAASPRVAVASPGVAGAGVDPPGTFESGPRQPEGAPGEREAGEAYGEREAGGMEAVQEAGKGKGEAARGRREPGVRVRGGGGGASPVGEHEVEIPKWVRSGGQPKPKAKRTNGRSQMSPGEKSRKARSQQNMYKDTQDGLEREDAAEADALAAESPTAGAQKDHKQQGEAETDAAVAMETGDVPHSAAVSPPRPDNLDELNSQAVQRSSDNAENSSANVRQGVGVETWEGKNATSPGRRRRGGSGGAGSGGLENGGSGAPRKAAGVSKEGEASLGWGRKASKIRKQASPEPLEEIARKAGDTRENSAQTAENVAENEGMATRPERGENLSRRTSSKGGLEVVNGVGSPLKLTPVVFVEGDEKEHLGELDLNQLDSFRDLWLTIRSAYSARLPKRGFQLVYKDVDNDLMRHLDEPWDYFKSVARSLLLVGSKA